MGSCRGNGKARGGGGSGGSGGGGPGCPPVQRPSSDWPQLPVRQLDHHPVSQAPRGGSSGGGEGGRPGNPPVQQSSSDRPQLSGRRSDLQQVTQPPRGGGGGGGGGGPGCPPVQQPSSDWPQLPVRCLDHHPFAQPPRRGGSGGGEGEGGTGCPSVQQPSSFDRPQPPVRGFDPHLVTRPAPPVIAPATVKTFTSSNHTKETGTKLRPMRRPDKGGTNAVRSIWLLANHFPVKFKSDSLIMQYDVEIKPEVPPKKSGLVRISKSTQRMIVERLSPDDLPSKFRIAYDGEKSIFSVVALPTGQRKVKLSQEEETNKVCTFIVTINLVKQLELQKLNDYLSGKLPNVPRDVLQAMDVVVKENPARHMISFGGSFYSSKVETHGCDLGRGIVASRGFQQSLKATAQGISLCMDHTVVPMLKPLPVLDFLKERVRNFSVQDFKANKSKVESVLRGLKVSVTHRRTSKKFTVAGLSSQATGDISFLIEDPERQNPPKKVMLVDYFKQRYEEDIKYKHIPCLNLGKINRINYVPMEFCTVAEGQRYPKEKLDGKAACWLGKESVVPPDARQKKICAMVEEEDGPCGKGIIDCFGIDISKQMTAVSGRVIGPPELKLGGSLESKSKVHNITVDKEKCYWNMNHEKGVMRGVSVKRWAILDFSRELHSQSFRQRLIEQCSGVGIQMEDALFCRSADMYVLSDFPKLREILVKIKEVVPQLQILICVSKERHPGYGYLKWFAETRIGMVTQFCLSYKVGDRNYLPNLALKLNAKLGGSNVELRERLPLFQSEKEHVMFIGADVNHPGSLNATSPSIAAVVATMNWPAASRYAARICPQPHREEKIQNFGGMCLELFENYINENKAEPKKIVVFRDGVSEGQFDMVLNEELLDLRRALQGKHYNATITLIVARKKHLTRFFPQANAGPSRNMPPGTVVDTKVVHQSEFDFYLCSHYGTLGTSRPTHYHVLYDEHKFSSDQMQKLIYNLCFTFARCTKPVSLVPPVYYADLAAYRGRLYCDAMLAEAQASCRYASSSSSSSGDWLDQKSYRLHASLENTMFFI